MRKKIIVVATGGTIAMKLDHAKGGLVPACSGEDLANTIPGLNEIADVEILQFSNIISSNMTPEIMFELHKKIQEILEDKSVYGVVVTHGTDTLEETGYFLNLLHQGEKPIVLTAAMRGASDLGYDGSINILCAVRAAADDATRKLGVLICLNEMLFSPVDVTKTHSANPATFQSHWWGPLGYVDCDRIIVRRQSPKTKKFSPKTLSARVDLIKAQTGSGREYIDFAVNQGCRGIVIEGFGRGNLPQTMIPAIKDAAEKGVAVVITTRVLGGRVLNVYAAPGSVTDSRNSGAAMGGEISGPKARLKLMIILSEHPEWAHDRAMLEKLFDE